MEITVADLQKDEELIAEDIDSFCQDMVSVKLKPVYDGIVDVEKYVNGETFRICWVLKELYDKNGGDWYLSEFLSDEKRWRQVAKHPVWKRVIYTTYGIVNDFHDYSDMDYITDDPEMVQCLKHIAVINVNKMPAGTTSKDADIAKKYEHNKTLLLRQLEKYNPQIIIFGNTFQHFQNDLAFKDDELTDYYKDVKKPKYIVKNDKLFIDTYHPAVRENTMAEADYVQSIIDIAKKCKEYIG